MPERLLTALRQHAGRLLAVLLAGFAGLAACDAYYTFATHPHLPELAPWVDLTGSPSLTAVATVGLVLFGGLIALHGLSSDPLDAARTVGMLGLAALLCILGALDLSGLKPSLAGDIGLLAPAGGVLVFGILRGLHWPLAARLYAVAGLLLLATNPLTDRLERWLAGNPNYYAFDTASQTYVFDQQAWHALWAVSRTQEVSELGALACLLMALLYVATTPTGQSGVPLADAPRVPGPAKGVSTTGHRQQ